MKKQISKMITSAVLMAIIYVGSAYAAPIYPTVDGYMQDNPLNKLVDIGPDTLALLAQYLPTYDSGVRLEDKWFIEFDISALSGTLSTEPLLTKWYSSGDADETVSLFEYYSANDADSDSPKKSTFILPEPMTIALLSLGGLFLRRK